MPVPYLVTCNSQIGELVATVALTADVPGGDSNPSVSTHLRMSTVPAHVKGQGTLRTGKVSRYTRRTTPPPGITSAAPGSRPRLLSPSAAPRPSGATPRSSRRRAIRSARVESPRCDSSVAPAAANPRRDPTLLDVTEVAMPHATSEAMAQATTDATGAGCHNPRTTRCP